MREKRGRVSGFILFLICILIWSGGSGNHPTKNIISVARSKSEKNKYPKPCPSIYVWAVGRFVRVDRVRWVFAHP